MSKDLAIEITSTDVKISEATGYTGEDVAIAHRTIAKGTTASELAYFLKICRTVNLNPFNKEIWCYKDNRGNLIILTGRDGFLSKAQSNPAFAGIRSSEVCKNDVFEMDIANASIKHVPNYMEDRGEIVGAYAIVFRKGGEPTIEWADFATYNKGWNVWKADPASMIKKVAESHALKKAFGISGIQSEYDFVEKDGKVTPIREYQDCSLETLEAEYSAKRSRVPDVERERIEQIITDEEKESYSKTIEYLKGLQV